MNDVSPELNKLNKKEYHRQYDHDTYYYRKAHGICVQCGKADAIRGKTRCFDCAYKNSIIKKKKYKQLTAEEKNKKMKKINDIIMNEKPADNVFTARKKLQTDYTA